MRRVDRKELLRVLWMGYTVGIANGMRNGQSDGHASPLPYERGSVLSQSSPSFLSKLAHLYVHESYRQSEVNLPPPPFPSSRLIKTANRWTEGGYTRGH